MNPNRTLSRDKLKSLLTEPTILVGVTFVVQNFIRLFSTIILTRLLVPEAYGILGIITSVAFTVTMLTDVGFQAFMLRHKDVDTKYFRDAMWTIRFLRSLGIACVFFVLAEPIANWLGKPEALAALQLFSLSFIIDGVMPISLITALSDGKIARYCMIDILHTILGLMITLGLALVSPDSYTLVYSILIASIFRVMIFYFVLPGSFMVWQLDLRLLREVLSFGRYIVASSAITLVIMQLDKIAMARVLTIDALGVYYLALNIASIPRGLSGSIASKSLYPLYARSWKMPDYDMPNILYSSRKYIDLSFIAGCLAIFALSSLIIAVLYDNRYSAAETYLQILIIGVAPCMANMAINEFLVSKGVTSTTLSTNLVRLVWLATGALAAIWLLGPTEFLIAVSLTEYVAYGFLIVRLKQLGLIIWQKEILFILSLITCQAVAFTTYILNGII